MNGWIRKKKIKKRSGLGQKPGQKKPSRELRSVAVDWIHVPAGRRPLDLIEVEKLAASIKTLGLQNPIQVFFTRKGLSGKYILIAGHHRLEAVKSLGKREIACWVEEGDRRRFRMLELTENATRNDLTALVLAEQTAELAILLQDEDVSRHDVAKGKGRPQGLASRIAKKVPVKGKNTAAKVRNVQRGLQIASLTPQAKAAAKRLGLDNNATALRAAASETGAAAQIAKLTAQVKQKGVPRKGGDRARAALVAKCVLALWKHASRSGKAAMIKSAIDPLVRKAKANKGK